MATNAQRQALLAVPCGWCGATPGQPCHVRQAALIDGEGGQRRRGVRLLTTLDGGAHDARWRRALEQSAPVVTAAVAERLDREVAELVPAAPVDRPW